LVGEERIDEEDSRPFLIRDCDFENFERVQRVFGSLSLPEESGRLGRISRGGSSSRHTLSFSKTLLASNGANPVAKKLFWIVEVLKAPFLASAINSRKSSVTTIPGGRPDMIRIRVKNVRYA
jgi:hypothetical protein